MTEDDFYELIKQPEGNTLDYKRAWYDLGKTQRFKFIKDVLSMANTPREGPARIVMGVDWSAECGSTVVGLDEQPDDANIQQVFPRRKIQPAPAFHYHPLRFLGKQVGILEIPIGSDGPCMPLDDLEKVGNVYKLQKGAIYYRNGSQNDQAVGSDLDRIYRWFIKQRSNVGQSSTSIPQVALSTPSSRSSFRTHSQHDTLPIQLHPSPSEFKRALLATKRAKIAVTYEDGHVEEHVWHAHRISPSSNIIGNLRSRPKFRAGAWQRNGIAQVKATVIGPEQHSVIDDIVHLDAIRQNKTQPE